MQKYVSAMLATCRGNSPRWNSDVSRTRAAFDAAWHYAAIVKLVQNVVWTEVAKALLDTR